MSPPENGSEWYTRRDGTIRGPFTAEIVTRYILLGRISLDDEVSRDRQSWQTAATLTGLLPEEVAGLGCWQDYQRLVMARMRVDERRRDRRAPDADPVPAVDRRSGNERRQEDGGIDLMRRMLGDSVTAGQGRRTVFSRPVLIITLVLVIAMVAWLVPSVR